MAASDAIKPRRQRANRNRCSSQAAQQKSDGDGTHAGVTLIAAISAAFLPGALLRAGSAMELLRGNPFQERLARCNVVLKTDEELRMNSEHIKGTAKKVTGEVKDKAGKMTGDKDLQAEGKMDKAEGSAHKVAGDVKDAVKHATE